jgi:hypothetical protein
MSLLSPISIQSRQTLLYTRTKYFADTGQDVLGSFLIWSKVICTEITTELVLLPTRSQHRRTCHSNLAQHQSSIAMLLLSGGYSLVSS